VVEKTQDAEARMGKISKDSFKVWHTPLTRHKYRSTTGRSKGDASKFQKFYKIFRHIEYLDEH
jgi:hypothetical protein